MDQEREEIAQRLCVLSRLLAVALCNANAANMTVSISLQTPEDELWHSPKFHTVNEIALRIEHTQAY